MQWCIAFKMGSTVELPQNCDSALQAIEANLKGSSLSHHLNYRVPQLILSTDKQIDLIDRCQCIQDAANS